MYRTPHQSLSARLLGFLTALVLTFTLSLSAFAQAVTYGPGVQDALDGASLTDTFELIVSFDGDGPLTTSQIAGLAGIGVNGLYFNELPIAGVVATSLQADAIAGLSGVRSIYLNEQLQYENDEATRITGVDKLRTDSNLRTAMGLPYSGKGIGVMINDSGVDGAHPDLEFGENLVQNVAAQTNLQSLSSLLPYTPTEDVINTDIGGGHGTHVAGTIGGTGAGSGGVHEGVAPAADLIGYGSGAALFILDTIGAFDYALTHQFQYNIRVVSNSWGSTSDSGTPFDPNHPTNIATKKLADRGVIVVFSAGNSGPGEATISGNFKKAPWVVTVAAGDKQGNLAGFSSRGVDGEGGDVTINGTTYTWVDRPTVTAPGVDIISARASTSSLQALSATDDAELIDPAYLAYYTTMSGTSMACPHVSGIIALMLEADPTLDVYDVREILEKTASNMPGQAGWEAGAGYVNAYNAVVHTLGLREFGDTVNLLNDFNSNVVIGRIDEDQVTVQFDPVLDVEPQPFEVAADVSLVTARANVGENTVALVLNSPTGKRYGSSISLPVLGQNIAVSAPGEPGTWTIEVRGIGSISGVALDPLGVTNGTALPGTVDATIKMVVTGGYDGLDDVAGHDAQSFIEKGVNERFVDGDASGNYRPDDAITRAEMARYLVMGAGVRQSLSLSGGFTYGDVATADAPFAEAAAATGAALKDIDQFDGGVMLADGGSFNPDGTVSREELAYSIIQALGVQDVAAPYTGDVTVDYMGERIVLEDNGSVSDDLRGYVQLAIDFNLLNVQFSLTQGAYDLQPQVHATFGPQDAVSRGDFAVASVRFADAYIDGFDLTATDVNGGSESALRATAAAAQMADGLAIDLPKDFTLEQNYPNPFNPSTAINFSLPQNGPVRLAVYNVLGQQVALLVDKQDLGAGAHSVNFDASSLSSGVYLYRLETPGKVMTKQMTLTK